MPLQTPFAHKLFDQFNLYFGDSAPTSGTFDKGDMVLNSAPAVGAPLFWVCATAGSPGIWYPTFTPLANNTPQALTAAGTVLASSSLVTVSNFAGNITLASAVAAGSVAKVSVLALTTHAVTLVAASGNAIIGLNGAVTSATVAANLQSNGTTNWYRLS